MKQIRITFLLTLPVSMVGAKALAYDAKVDGIYYNFSRRNATVTYYGITHSSNLNAYYGSVVIPETVTYNGITYSVKSIDQYAFAHRSGLTSVIIPSSVTSIGNNAFEGCSTLRSVTIPNSIKSISYATFSGCSRLSGVTIPNSVKSIGGSAFQNCSGLTSITIPNSVTTIGNYAFSWCSSLEYVTFGTEMKEIGYRAFYHCSGLTQIISYASTPPFCDSVAFDEITTSTCTLRVPSGTLKTYKEKYPWKKFIIIDDISVKSASVVQPETKSVFDLNGRKQKNVLRGINIIWMSDGTSKKVIKQ